ncbi:MAG: hypothetical protein IKG42_01445 [Clostridia bacterium]|nr:hypothetical protein [Clostridia bacterium]
MTKFIRKMLLKEVLDVYGAPYRDIPQDLLDTQLYTYGEDFKHDIESDDCEWLDEKFEKYFNSNKFMYDINRVLKGLEEKEEGYEYEIQLCYAYEKVVAIGYEKRQRFVYNR